MVTAIVFIQVEPATAGLTAEGLVALPGVAEVASPASFMPHAKFTFGRVAQYAAEKAGRRCQESPYQAFSANPSP